MLDELLKSVRAQLYERATSPLMGGFVISWAAWNFKFILLALSGVAVLEKYRIIDEILYPSWHQVAGQGVVFPLLTALAYIFCYPYPASRVFAFSRQKQKELNDKKKEIEEATLLTVEESRAVRNEAFALEEHYQKQLARKDLEITRLKEDLESRYLRTSLEAEEMPKPPEPPELPEVTEGQIKIMLNIAQDANHETYEGMLVSGNDKEILKIKYNLDELVRNNYIAKEFDSEFGDIKYTLEPKGRAYLVEDIKV